MWSFASCRATLVDCYSRKELVWGRRKYAILRYCHLSSGIFLDYLQRQKGDVCLTIEELCTGQLRRPITRLMPDIVGEQE